MNWKSRVHNVVCFSVCVSVCVLLLGYEVCRRKEGLEGPGHIVWILLQEYFGCTAGMRILSENNSCSCGDWEVHHVLIHTAIQLKYLKALSFYTHTHTHNRGSVKASSDKPFGIFSVSNQHAWQVAICAELYCDLQSCVCVRLKMCLNHIHGSVSVSWRMLSRVGLATLFTPSLQCNFLWNGCNWWKDGDESGRVFSSSLHSTYLQNESSEGYGEARERSQGFV